MPWIYCPAVDVWMKEFSQIWYLHSIIASCVPVLLGVVGDYGMNTKHGWVRFLQDLLFPPLTYFLSFLLVAVIDRAIWRCLAFIISEGVSDLELKSVILDWFSRRLFFFYPMTFTLCQSVNTPGLNRAALAYPCLHPKKMSVGYMSQEQATYNFYLLHIFFLESWTLKTPPSVNQHHYPTQPLPSASSVSLSSEWNGLYCTQQRLQYPTEPIVNHPHHHAKQHCLHSCLVWHLCPAALSSFWQRAIPSVSWCCDQWRAWVCWWVALLISLTTLSRLPSAHESLCPLGFSPATPSNGPEGCQSRPWPGLWWLLQWCDHEVGLSDWTVIICQDYCLLAQQMSSYRWPPNS